MSGLRERKKAATRIAIRDAGMRLFDEHGFGATTIDRIAEEAGVSRATVFGYFPTKEHIVFGDASAAISSLADVLREPAEGGTIAAVRAWLRQLAGWIEPELVLQLRLAREVPAISARRLQLYDNVQHVVADALHAELGTGERMAAELAAGSLIAALRIVEETAGSRMAEHGGALPEAEIDRLFDDAVAFAEAGVAAIGAR